MSGTVSTGTGAHIFSARPKGPRGDGGLNLTELKAYNNGIWCCDTHGHYIDANGGNGFDASTLAAYRRLAEVRAALRQQGRLPPPAGWFHKLRVDEAPPLKGGSDVYFGKNTLVFGENGSGKTILADMLAGLGKTERWSRYADDADRRLSFSIDYYDPEPRHVETVVGPRGEAISSSVDSCAALPVPRVAIVHWSHDRFKRTDDDATGLDVLASILGEDRNSVRAALLTTRTKGLLGARVVGDDLEYWLAASPEQLPGSSRQVYHGFGSLGGTEQLRLGLEASIALARQRAMVQTTMLIVDDISGRFDEKWTKYLLDLLTDPTNPFQTLVVTAYTEHWPSDLGSWTMVELVESVGLRFEVREDLPLMSI
jgi:energy-coupling factor transporter ATP-binding protein EcfA2